MSNESSQVQTLKFFVLLSIGFGLPFLTATENQADAMVELLKTQRKYHP